MAASFFPFRRRSYTVRALESPDAEALAELHTEDFTRPWTEDEFTALLGEGAVFGFAAVEEGAPGTKPCGFVLARMAAGEAEILTLAVGHAYRRRGLGYMLMDAVLRHLHAERAEALFLEVDETNHPAIALYRRLGFREVGRRPDYYEHKATGRTAALVMRRDLR